MDGFLFNLKVKDLTTSSWICLLKLGLRPSFFLMSLLGWVSVQSASGGSHHEFLDLFFEAGPKAQPFFLMSLLGWVSV